ncbi:unnamed protein product [Caenorhabditis sp. 36 PRJEB53466]|nr:unnamed protein product [Caenorhabditis sp. 36 PRJEB53466]
MNCFKFDCADKQCKFHAEAHLHCGHKRCHFASNDSLLISNHLTVFHTRTTLFPRTVTSITSTSSARLPRVNSTEAARIGIVPRVKGDSRLSVYTVVRPPPVRRSIVALVRSGFSNTAKLMNHTHHRTVVRKPVGRKLKKPEFEHCFELREPIIFTCLSIRIGSLLTFSCHSTTIGSDREAEDGETATNIMKSSILQLALMCGLFFRGHTLGCMKKVCGNNARNEFRRCPDVDGSCGNYHTER